MVTYGLLATIPIVIHDFFTWRDILLCNQNQMRSVHDGHCFGDEVTTPTMVHQPSQATRFSCGIHTAQEENAPCYKRYILCPPSVTHLMQIMNGAGSHSETQTRGWTQQRSVHAKLLTVITDWVRTCCSYISRFNPNIARLFTISAHTIRIILATKWQKTRVFWDVLPCHWVSSPSHFEGY